MGLGGLYEGYAWEYLRTRLNKGPIFVKEPHMVAPPSQGPGRKIQDHALVP